MRKHQVVIISGKTCSGKTGLATALKDHYGFEIVATRDILNSQLELGGRDSRPALIEEARSQDEKSNSRWILEGVKPRFDALTDEPGIVVDHVSTADQVRQFRECFGSQLVHVHLYATRETLLKRYSETENQHESLPYEEIDHLTDEAVQNLKDDADVRIFTDRTDNEDTLVRVAAQLHLLTPPDLRCVDVLVGGQYGSEGKGNIVAFLASEYDVLVRVGGPNAGHTVANSDGKVVHHQLPSGTLFSTAKILLGPGITLNVASLLKEIVKSRVGPDRLFIDPQATIIEEEDIAEEQGGVVGSIASTGSGSGEAKARRIRNRGKPDKPMRLAMHIPELKQYLGSTVEHLELAYRHGHSVLLEGTQGSALSLYHGEYPYVTSRDTNVAGCLAEAGISPSRVRRILMVVRTTPIRVADPDGTDGHTSGHLKKETTFRFIAERAGLDPDEVETAEKTSTTNRKRRVGWFEWSQFRRACNLNAPTDIVLTFVDYLKATNQKARRFEQLDPDTIKFIEELERVAQAPVSLINTRFPLKEGDFKDLRSIIDRRNWTARSRSW